MDSPRVEDSPGADARSEGGGSVAARELTEEQKQTLKKSRPVMLGLLVFFFGIAFHDTARLYVCVIQLILMGVLSLSWDEESFLNSKTEMSIKERISGLFCQCGVVLTPLAVCAAIVFAISTMDGDGSEEDLVPSNDPVT